MNNKIACALAFVAGAAVGSAVTWKLVKTKYEKIADEEIASVKEVFSKKDNTDSKETSESTDESEDEEDSDLEQKYQNILGTSGYGKPSVGEAKREDAMQNKDIYVIPPEEFGECEYKEVSLTYYADKVLAYDENFEIIHDVDKVVGPDALTSFGRYEDDSVFIRDDKNKIDYEILLSLRKYFGDLFDDSHPVDEDTSCETM